MVYLVFEYKKVAWFSITKPPFYILQAIFSLRLKDIIRLQFSVFKILCLYKIILKEDVNASSLFYQR